MTRIANHMHTYTHIERETIQFSCIVKKKEREDNIKSKVNMENRSVEIF